MSMLRGDNVFADRDTGGAGSVGPGVRPSVASINIRVLLQALERLGVDAETVIATAGVLRTDLDDPDARFSVKTYLAILAYVRRERPDLRNLALRVAAATPLGAYPLIDYLVVTSDTVGHGFKQLARHFSLSGAPVSLELEAGGDPIQVLVRSPFHPFGAEYAIALHFFHTKREVEGEFSAIEIALPQQPDEIREWEAAFGCRVVIGASWTGMALSREVWRLPFRRRNPALREVLERHATDVAARLPMPSDVAIAVRRTLTWRLVEGETRIEDVARRLAMTPRTLQRRLASVGLAYHTLLDEVRRVSAEQHLADSMLSIGEIAHMLGYADRPTFHRAFRRWTGMTPQGFREQRAEPESK